MALMDINVLNRTIIYSIQGPGDTSHLPAWLDDRDILDMTVDVNSGLFSIYEINCSLKR